MRASRKLWILLLVAVCSVFFEARTMAQETRGSIVGRVTDTTGAVVPAAVVKATHLQRNVTVESLANAQGNYQILFLVPGMYRVTATVAGFKTFLRDDIEVRLGDRINLDIALEVGEVTERVLVEGGTPLLETANANVGQVVASRNVSDLPTAHGNLRSFFVLLPGITQGTFGGAAKFVDPTRPFVSAYVTINGAPLGTTEFTLDGTPNVQTVNTTRLGMSHQPTADSIQELKLETAYDANVGYTSGSNINMTVKSGTNELHGTLWGFFRDTSFYGNDWFANRIGQPRGEVYYRRTGFNFGAPVTVPKLYRGKDRTFLFYSMERYDDGLAGNQFTGSVPTAAQRRGDFSQLLARGPAYQIYDPKTIAPAPGGRFSRQPFPGNMIPADRINPVAKAISSYWPEPNAPGLPDGTNNFVNQVIVTPTIQYSHIARLDHTVSEKYRLFGRFIYDYKDEGPYNDYLANIATGAIFRHSPIGIAVANTVTPAPNLVIDLRYSYNHHVVSQVPKSNNFDMTQLGFSSAVVDQLGFRHPATRLFPWVDVSALPSLGIFLAVPRGDDIHALDGSVNRPIGNHSVSFGGGFRSYREFRYEFGNATPRFIADSTYTNGPLDNSAASPLGLGQGYGSFLLGIPTGGWVDFNDSMATQSNFFHMFAQDNWRVTPKLTLTLGLRYEYEVPLTERFNRSVRGFDSTAQLSVTDAARANYAANSIPEVPINQFQPLGGLLFAGIGGQPRTLWNGDRRKFMPRVGFAYTIGADTVVRGGYGIYYLLQGQPYATLAQQFGYNQRTNIIPSLDNGLSFIATLDNPFPSSILRPVGNTLGANTFVGQSITFFNPELKAPYNQRWNLNVQHLLPGRVLLEVAYAGSRTVRLPVQRDLNALPLSYLSTLPVRNQAVIDRLTAQVRNPFYPLLPGTALAGQNVAVSQLVRPFPQFTSVFTNVNQGYSWYHALQLRSERRFAQGYSFMLAYTFSKLMEATSYLNAADPLPYRALSASDRRHHLAVTGIYELPFGRGKKLLATARNPFREIVSGWQVNVIALAYSGLPLNFGNVIFNGNPDDLRLSGNQRNVDRWFNVNAGFERNAGRQLDFNRRTFPLRFSNLRAPVFKTWDASLIKNTRIRENIHFQFRAEAFNVFNIPTFGAPNMTVTSSAFGAITTTEGFPRQLQLAARLIF